MKDDAKYLVHAKATYYPDFIRIWIPNQPYLRKREGFELKTKSSSKLNDNSELYESNEERSLRRTRKAIKDYALCNDFDLFATFTLADDRFNDERSKRRLATWFKNQRNRNGKFKYIIVAERHKNGALHFHALIGGYTGRLVYGVNPHNGEYISDGRGNFVRNFEEYKLGINSAKVIGNKDSKTKTAYYLQKYINKDMVIVIGKNRYWASQGLNKPMIDENPEPFYKAVEADRHWVVDHGTVLEFDRDKNVLIDMLLGSHNS
ncbi:MAG: hypothetical protein JWO54_827 [Candidatus Saccharibacteria bacterium]|nr:hypothetical protein [Candidatus Saccharibacteria bacterium]